jgi:hypothetical protein
MTFISSTDFILSCFIRLRIEIITSFIQNFFLKRPLQTSHVSCKNISGRKNIAMFSLIWIFYSIAHLHFVSFYIHCDIEKEKDTMTHGRQECLKTGINFFLRNKYEYNTVINSIFFSWPGECETCMVLNIPSRVCKCSVRKCFTIIV